MTTSHTWQRLMRLPTPVLAALTVAVFAGAGIVTLQMTRAETPDSQQAAEQAGTTAKSGATSSSGTKRQATKSPSKATANKKATKPTTSTTPGATASAAAASGGENSQAAGLPDPGTYNVTVDFATAVAQLDTSSLGGTVSGYGTAWATAGGQCANAPCTAMKRLSLGMQRVSIQWNNGVPVSGAGGNGNGGAGGDQLIDGIRAAGAEPVLVIGGKGGQNDMDFTDADAAGLVGHYTSGRYAAAPVRYFVVGNEPSNSGNGSMTIGQYCTRFNSAASAMRAVNPSIKLVGPAWPYYDLNVIQQFLNCAGSQVDVIDYHAYGQSGQGIDANIASSATVYEQQNRDVRAAINSLVPGRAGQISQQVGEYNVSPFASSDTSDERFYSAGTTVWNALATGSILKGGGRAFIFADQNNPLGLIFQSGSIAGIYGRSAGDPQPAYHGMGMFSGEGLFRRFGSTMVKADSSSSDIVAYASSNARNIVLINRNRDAARTAQVGLQGFSQGTAGVWQTNKAKPFDSPAAIGSYRVGKGFSLNLPPYSVTTITLD
jgi:hypothetical protein